MIYHSVFLSIARNASRYPLALAYCFSSGSRYWLTSLPSSVFLSISYHGSSFPRFPVFEGTDRIHSGVTFNVSQMIMIFSDVGFVLLLFHSLIVLCEIPVFSENFFCVIPISPSLSFSLFWRIFRQRREMKKGM